MPTNKGAHGRSAGGGRTRRTPKADARRKVEPSEDRQPAPNGSSLPRDISFPADEARGEVESLEDDPSASDAGEFAEDHTWRRFDTRLAYEGLHEPSEQLEHTAERFETNVTRRGDPTRIGTAKLPPLEIVAAKVLAALSLAVSRGDHGGTRGAYRWAESYLDDVHGVARPQTADAAKKGAATDAPLYGRALLSRRRVYERLINTAARCLQRLGRLPREALAKPEKDKAVLKRVESAASALLRTAAASGRRGRRTALAEVRGHLLRMLAADGDAHSRADAELLVRIVLVELGVVANRDAARDWCKGAVCRGGE